MLPGHDYLPFGVRSISWHRVQDGLRYVNGWTDRMVDDLTYDMHEKRSLCQRDSFLAVYRYYSFGVRALPGFTKIQATMATIPNKDVAMKASFQP